MPLICKIPLCKLIFLLGFVINLVLSINTVAQNSTDLFIKSGLSLSSQFLRINEIPKDLRLTHEIKQLYIGVGIVHRFSKKHSLEIAIINVEKGMRMDYAIYLPPNRWYAPDWKYEVKLKYLLRYIDIPLVYGFNFKRYRINSGCVVSYLYSASSTFFSKVTNYALLPNTPSTGSFYSINDEKVNPSFGGLKCLNYFLPGY